MDAGHWRMDGSLDCGGWKTRLEKGEFRQAVWEAMSIKDPP